MTTAHGILWFFVLMRFFQKSQQEAEKITRDVHHKGVGLAGVYAFELAETKVNQVNRTARQEGTPFTLHYGA